MALERILHYANAEQDEPEAIATSAELARLHGASLTVVDVIAQPSWARAALGRGDGGRALVREARRARLLSLLDRAQPSGVTVDTKLLEGESEWLSLLREVRAGGYDLLLKTAAGDRPLGLFGPTAKHLFRKCPCPVYVAPEGARALPRRVLLALDPGQDEPAREAAAKALVDLTKAFVAPLAVELHVVFAWDFFGEALLERQMGEVVFAQLLAETEASARSRLAEVLARHDLGRATPHVAKGNPARVVPALAAQLDADLLVLGSTGRTGLRGILIGSTAEALLGRVRCPVLVVKPPGFVVPMEIE